MQEGSLQMGAREPRRGQIPIKATTNHHQTLRLPSSFTKDQSKRTNQQQDSPPMKDPALGDDSLVDLGSRIEGEDHRIPPEPMEEVSQEMELE